MKHTFCRRRRRVPAAVGRYVPAVAPVDEGDQRVRSRRRAGGAEEVAVGVDAARLALRHPTDSPQLYRRTLDPSQSLQIRPPTRLLRQEVSLFSFIAALKSGIEMHSYCLSDSIVSIANII